jgi:ABC-2 type transport system ATP-binding protein
MSLIEVSQLSKRFKQAVKEPGLLGAIKHLYHQKYNEKWAVNGIDFSINFWYRTDHSGTAAS